MCAEAVLGQGEKTVQTLGTCEATVGETGGPAEKVAAPGIPCVGESRIPQGHQLEPVSRDRVGAWQEVSEHGPGCSGDRQVSCRPRSLALS